ncbi:MAG: hypothetical protein Q7K42_02480, partial [Candidatus Diapherotrites archaeon]|nr:hypothetical protein [Candidatus Diapherotrites archaeon]
MPLFKTKLIGRKIPGTRNARKKTKTFITRGEKIGGRIEGHVYKANVEIEHKTRKGNIRKKTIEMVEKEFRKLNPNYVPGATLYRPELQNEVMSEVIELNKRKNLGLRIINTIRLKKRFLRKPTLVMTKLENLLEEIYLNKKQNKEFTSDMQWQIAILKKEGFYCHKHAFFPQLDTQTGKVVAVIGDP